MQPLSYSLSPAGTLFTNSWWARTKISKTKYLQNTLTTVFLITRVVAWNKASPSFWRVFKMSINQHSMLTLSWPFWFLEAKIVRDQPHRGHRSLDERKGFSLVMLNPSEIFSLNLVVILTPVLCHVSTSRAAHLNWQYNSALSVHATVVLPIGAMEQIGGGRDDNV